MHMDPLALRKKGDPKSRKELIELPTLLWLVTILLPTAPGSLVTGTVVQAVVARGASLRLSPVFCLVCVCVCEGQEVHFQLSFSWGGYSLSITVTDKQQGGEKGRKEGNFEGTTQQLALEILPKVVLVEHQKSWGSPGAPWSEPGQAGWVQVLGPAEGVTQWLW